MFRRIKRLSEMGILGINRRNTHYTQQYNPRKLFPLVDDKLTTKKLAQSAGIAVPELYGVIEYVHQVHQLREMLEPYEDVAIKPARGSGGVGILILRGRAGRMFQRSDGEMITQEEVRYHVLNILSGLYSLGGQRDKAIIEYRVRFDPMFTAISYLGVPDIRIIVFQGVPVISMVRLPTRASCGRANLHQGAIGAGIDLSSGITLTGVWHDTIVTKHPDTRQSITGLQIPNWLNLLKLASRCYELTGLGYQGVDIVLDGDKGPLILELNARPGLSVQIANQAGLLPRLRLVKEHREGLRTVDERVRFARMHFSS